MTQVAAEAHHATPAGSASRGALGALVHHAAVEEVDGAVRVAREARVVRDHADRGAAAVQLAQQLHHRLAVLRVEVPGGLVGEQDRGLPDQRARHGHALLLAAGELAG